MKSYLGMYDVSSPKLRSAIFKLLSAYGIHQQKSVFECQLSFDLKKQLIEQITMLTQHESKRIIFIKIYPNHVDTILLGAAKRMPSSSCLYIG